MNMKRIVRFNQYGTTDECPIAIEMPCDECLSCEYNEGHDGFDVYCSHSPNVNEDGRELR